MLIPIYLCAGLAIARRCGADWREVFAAAIGFVLAPLSVPTFILAYESSQGGVDAAYSVAGFVLAYLVALAFAVVLGVPAFLLLRPFRPGHWWSVASAGALLGCGVALLLRLPSVPNFHDLMVEGAMGGVSAIMFWLIWRFAGRIPMPRRDEALVSAPPRAE